MKRDVGFLGPHARQGGTTVASERERGYRDAMIAAGLTPRAFGLAAPPEGREAELGAFLARADRPRALACWSDLDAVPLLGLAAGAGLRVPEDLAVVGYDNSPVAALPLVGLASIDQGGRRIGRTAAQGLLERLGGRSEPRHVLVEPSLVERPSL